MLTSREHAHCVRSGPARGPACAPAEALLALRRPTPRPGSTCTSLAARRALSSSWRSCPSWRAGWHSRARSPGTAPPPSAPFWRGRPSVGTSWALGCQSTAGAYNSMVKARSVHIFLAEVRQGCAHFAVSRFAMLALPCRLWPFAASSGHPRAACSGMTTHLSPTYAWSGPESIAARLFSRTSAAQRAQRRATRNCTAVDWMPACTARLEGPPCAPCGRMSAAVAPASTVVSVSPRRVAGAGERTAHARARAHTQRQTDVASCQPRPPSHLDGR